MISSVKFVRAMKRKIAANRHKGHWRDCDFPYLFRRAKQEIGEVKTAIAKGKPPEEVLLESADVANFMMMIADNYAVDYAERDAEKSYSLKDAGPR